MRPIRIKSFAKVNLSLNVTGKLKSKLHKIESLVTFLDLYDIIFLKKIISKKHCVSFVGKFSKRINKKNTVIKLLDILDKKNLLNNKKFYIKIHKNIPVKSGLGGGSMNASFLLSYFIKKKIIKIKNKELREICDLIGSDVILGVNPKNTILSSKNSIKRFNVKLKYYVLIIKPSFGCVTKNIYSKVKNYSRSLYNKPDIAFFNKQNIKNSKNELERIAFQQYPKLKTIKIFLSKLDNINFSRMTGSGSAILGYFSTKKDIDEAAKVVKKRFKSYWCIKSKTI